MNNKLTIWYEKHKADEVQTDIKRSLYHHFSIGDSDIELTENGFKFLFDDETNGDIEINLTPENDSLKVTISGTWAWEVIAIYDYVIPDYAPID